MADYLSTTQIVTYVRQRVTPTILWSAIGALVTTLVVCITWIVTMQSDVHRLNEHDAESKKSIADWQQKFDILQDIKTQLAVMNSKLDNQDAEIKRQGAKWDRVEEVADSPPHATRKRR